MATLKLLLNKTTPRFIGPPNRVQILLGLGHSDALIQHAIQKQKCGNPHVGRAMNKYPTIFESRHHPAERLKILVSGRSEIHRNMYIRHTEAGHDGPLVCQCIVRGRKRKIDYRLKTGLANCLKLISCGLARSAKPFTYGVEIVNLR